MCRRHVGDREWDTTLFYAICQAIKQYLLQKGLSCVQDSHPFSFSVGLPTHPHSTSQASGGFCFHGCKRIDSLFLPHPCVSVCMCVRARVGVLSKTLSLQRQTAGSLSIIEYR